MAVSYDQIIKDHLAAARLANKHPAKLLALSKLLSQVFNVEITDLIPGIETHLGSRILGLKGSVDLLFSDVVLEIKVDLAAELDDAERELFKYFQALLERNPDKKYIGIVTNDIQFLVYVPRVSGDRVEGITKISEIDASSSSSSDFVIWLDSFVFSKTGITPTAEDLKWRFGPKSGTYAVAFSEFQSMWHEIESAPDAKLKLSLWGRNMQIVYGSEPSIEVFLGHTYLVTLVKLLIYLKLSGDRDLAEQSIRQAVSGEFFTSYGISNLIEEDFFSWILHDSLAQKAIQLSRKLCRSLLRYDISQIGEDLFKEIYEELVELGQRHMIGEYYTPEWLSELVTREALAAWRDAQSNTRKKILPRLLDPACGSGTFLTNAIKIYRDELGRTKPETVLHTILTRVCGLDINPLAVIISRANYIIALGDVLKTGTKITIPVHLSDAIKTPHTTKTYYGGVEVLDVAADGHQLQIPVRISSNREVFDGILDAFRQGLAYYKTNKDREAAKHSAKNAAKQLFRRQIETTKANLDENESTILGLTFDSMIELTDEGRNSVWVFMLSNIYFPISLKAEPFDVIVGNPPWLGMRSIENENYQNFLKEQVFQYNLLDSKEIHLFAHVEMATLYFCRAADLYLQDEGVIAFLMPISVITGASHHARFQQFNKPEMNLCKVLNFQKVQPIFHLPVCALLAKKGTPTQYPVEGIAYTGRIGEYRRNVGLSVVLPLLKSEPFEYSPHSAPTTRSFYYDRMKVGASMYPHNFWYIEFHIHPTLQTFNLAEPLVKTDSKEAGVGHEPWKKLVLQGNVDSDFIYATLLGKDLIPFGHLNMRPVILPIELSPTRREYRLLDLQELRRRGWTLTSEWLETVEKLWTSKRTKKSIENFPSATDRLNYQNLLTMQNPAHKYIILYNARGADSMACVIKRNRLPKFNILNLGLAPRGFICDITTFYLDTDEEDEAHFLCAVLNSTVIRERVKPFQPDGLYGKRDIGRRPFMLLIPEYKDNDASHLQLVKLSKLCHETVARLSQEGKGFRTLRHEALKAISDKQPEIDEIVTRLLS
jgi:hypothetical protein